MHGDIKRDDTDIAEVTLFFLTVY